MRRLHIDFARPSPRAALLRLSPRALVVLAAALALVAVAAWHAQALSARADTERADVARLRAALARRTAVRPQRASPAIAPAQAQAVNAAIAQLNLPWGAVWDALEHATPRDIALVALEPDTGRRVLRITAEARNADTMIAYVEQLKREEFFPLVLLSRHEINEQDPNKPLRFQLEAAWRAP